MKDNTFVVTVNKDGQYNTKYYSEEDYNTKVVPFLSEHYTPDQYSVANLQLTTADNIKEDGQYLVSVNANGATQRKAYTGKELLGGKLATIGQRFPDYSLQFVDGAVRPAEGSDEIIAIPWQQQMAASAEQMKKGIGNAMQSVNDAAEDVKTKNLSDLLKERGDAMVNFANMAVYNGMTKTPEELEQMHQEEVDTRALRDINKELESINNELGEWADHENNIEDYLGPHMQWIMDNAERKDQLLQRKAELVQQQTNNPIYKKEDNRLNAIADNILDKAYPAMADLSVEGDLVTSNNPEAEVWQAARYFADNAKTTLAAPDDNANGFVSFLKGHGATFSDADFWLAGLESITSNMKVKKVFDTISEKVANFADENLGRELSEGDFDNILTDAEKNLLLSFVTASEAQALRALNTNNMYNAGITAANSLGFMAQFFLTAGAGDAFATGVKKGAKGLAKWLAKNTGRVGAGAARMAEEAGATLVGRGVAAATDALVTPLLKTVPMTLMQTGLYKDYAQKLTERDELGNLKYDYDTAVLPALRDAGLEVWSEMALEPVLSVFGKTFGMGLDKLAGRSRLAAFMKTKLDDVATFFHNREAMEILTRAGFDGYFEEIGEEILGAGVSSMWDPEAWAQFWEHDNLVSMAVAFAPMSIIGGGMSMVNYVKKEMAYDEIAPSVQEMLRRRGVLTDEQIGELFNRNVGTMQDVADKLSAIINPIVESGNITAQEFKALWDFADITAQKEIANTLVKRVEEDRRLVMRSQMNQQMNGRQFTGKDADGNETVSYYVDEKGNRRYVIVDAENADGLCVSMDANGQDMKIVDINELEVTTMGANAFYDEQWKAQNSAAEQQRMAQESAQQRQSVNEALRQNKSIMLFNSQTNQKEKYVFLGWNGANAVVANAQSGQEEERTVQELANALNIDSAVLTDAQREQAQIDESRKNDSIARSANDYKGAPVTFNGVSGTLLRITSKGDENGNSSLVASVITQSGELVPVTVTAKDVEDFIDERKETIAAGNAEVADRRTRANQKKAQDRKDSEAYRSSKEKYTNPDGTIREGEFLDNDPRGFAMYSDGKYGKNDTDATLNAALANAQAKAQQALAAKDAEANPDAKQALRAEYDSAVAALDTLDKLIAERKQDESSSGALNPEAARAKYMEFEDLGLNDEEIYELAMRSIQEAQERIAALPRPEVSTDVQAYMEQKQKYSEAVAAEQQKIDYWRSILSAPMTQSEKQDVNRANARMQRRVADIQAEMAATKDAATLARLDQELKDVAKGFIGEAIKDLDMKDVPVMISSAASIEADMRAAESSEASIKSVLNAIRRRRNPKGFYDQASNTIFVIADFNTDVAEARTTFVHERQHARTASVGLENVLIERLGLTGLSDDEKKAVLLPELHKLVRTDFYDGMKPEVIADEIISFAVEHEFNGTLDALGVNEIITNFAKNIDNEREQAASILASGFTGNGSGAYRVTDSGDERAQEAGSGAVGEQGSGSLGRGGSSVAYRLDSPEDHEQLTLPLDEEISVFSAPAMADADILSAAESDTGIRFNISTEGDVLNAVREFAASPEGKRMGWTPAQIEEIAQETTDLLNYIHANISGDPNYDEFAKKQPTIKVDWRDGKERPTVTWHRNNIEYKFDMSSGTYCINNEAIETALSSPVMVDLILHTVDFSKYTTDDYLTLYETLRDLGFVVPCKGCFDAATRIKMLPSVAQNFADLVNQVIDERNADPEAFDAAIKAMPGQKTESGFPAGAANKLDAIRIGVAGDNLTEHISFTQLLSAEGQTKALADWGGIFRAWQRTGTSKPKDKLMAEPYTGVIMQKSSTIIAPYGETTPSFRDKEVNMGTGLRRNSHDEFRIETVIDEIQFMRDAWLKGLRVFKYMKELDDVRLFGRMGAKYNMSGFPGWLKGGPAAGLDMDGNYYMSEESVGGREFPYQGEDGNTHYDGMKGLQEAIRYINEDVSLSSVIMSMPHFIKALTDVPTPTDKSGIWGSLIPFHASGATAHALEAQGLGKARGVQSGTFMAEAFEDYDKGVTNFEDVQNDRFGEGWTVLQGKRAGTAVKNGHKIEFANGTVYRNEALGITLYASPASYKSMGGAEETLTNAVAGLNGEQILDKKGNPTKVSGMFYTLDSEDNKVAHALSIDYNDKVREIGTKYAYKEAADYYVSELKGIGLLPRFDFEVPKAKFLEMCADARVDPHNPKLGWKGGSWSPADAESYYSVWCDYGMTDPSTGELSPHRIVLEGKKTAEDFIAALPENYVQIIQEGLERYTSRRDTENSMMDDAIKEYVNREVEQGKMDPNVVKEILAKHGIDESGLNFRVTDEQAEVQKAIDFVNGVKTYQEEGGDIRFSVRTKPAPEKTGIGYKVFFLKEGKLYPPMVANPNGADTPVGVWLDADAAPQAATSKTGRKKVKAGGKGTQGGSGTLAYRPGWHLGEIPYALQFNRGPKVDNPLGITGKNGKVIKVGKYFPANFVWAEVEYAKDVDYQDEAMSYGYNEAGNFQHSLAGLPKVPEDGSYTYRTNANPATDPWIITGAMKVNRILADSEVDELVSQAGREPQTREDNPKAFEERMAVVNSEQKKADGQYADADELDNIRFRLSNNNRATISKWLDKWAEARVNEASKQHGANTPRESFIEAAAKQKEDILNYLDKLNDSTMQLAWARWFCTGAVQMGAEDMPKVRQAVKIAKIHKVDPLQYDSPMAIIDQWPESIKDDPINPDEITTLHKVKELPDGIVIYDVDESEESRKNMREIINTHFGKDCSPWCLLQGDGNGKLTKYSADYWYKTYTAYTKQVAFKNGKLVAFSANSSEDRLWWDRQDSSHHGIPVIGKIKGDKLGRSATVEYSPEDGSLISVTNIVKGNRKDGKYMEWFSLDNETPRVEETFEHGYLVGRRVINYPNGQIREDENYENGSLSGRAVTYFQDGQIETDANYESGRLNGPFTSYYENGQVYYTGTYERGDKVGRWQTFYNNGQISQDEVYAKLWKPLDSVTYYPDGSKKSEAHSVSRPYGFGTVSEKEWDEQGRLVRSERMMPSSASHGYSDRDIHEITEYEYNGLGITMKKVEAYQGQRGMTLYSAIYFDDVLQKQTFVDKGAYNYNDVMYDEWYTADGKLATVTVQKLEKYNGDTVVDQLKYKYDEDGNISVKHLMMPRGLGYVKDEDLLVSETRDMLPGETIPSVDKLYQEYQANENKDEEEKEAPAPAKKEGKSIKDTVEETLAAANLYMDEDMGGDVSIGGTVNGEEYSFMVFDDFTYEDFLQNGYTEDELGRATPEQEEAYAKVQDEIDYYQVNGYWRDEAENEHNEPMFRIADEREKLFNDAKDEFGTTRDFREAGYLLPDGSMLDFSEKHNGGEPGRRGADHRDIGRVINDRNYETMTEYMEDFVNEGAIRLMPETGAVSLAQKPTKEQREQLRNFFYRYNGEVEVEIFEGTHTVADAYYRKRTSPTRVLNDINEYFDNGVVPTGNEVVFRTVEITQEVREEMNVIEATARVNGTYLKAPNGADTKLNNEQWAMVRTKSFKSWFGDWENDPANASKVVDENGEPMVVWHGSRSPGFTEFDSTVYDRNGNGIPMWISTKNWYAHEYSDPWLASTGDLGEQEQKEFEESEASGMTEDGTYALFANIRNPFNLGNINDDTDSEVFARIAETVGMTPKELEAYCEENRTDNLGYIWEITNTPEFAGLAQRLGYDGLNAVEHNVETYAFFSGNQVKSATVNNGEYSRENDDIRFNVESQLDNQGNPVDEEGRYILENVNSIDEITDQDFIRPSRNIKLPVISEALSKAIGAEGKDVIIKKNIFAKVARGHKELTPDDSRQILKNVLYATTRFGQNQKVTRPFNWILIHMPDRIQSVIVEVNPNKDNVEVVNWHYLDERTLALKEKQAVKEGGLILALDSAAGDTLNDLSSRSKDTNSSENSKPISPEQDEAFRKAYEANDTAAAQQMVKDAFKAAFPNTKVVDENGDPLVVYHGSPNSFTVFDASQSPLNGRYFGDGFYFSSSEELARKFADKYTDSEHRLIPAFLNIEDMIDIDAKKVKDFRNEEHRQRVAIWNEKHKTHDGVVLRNINDGYNIEADTYMVRDNSNIKSADPFTFDDNGELIPLSERFNPENEDIRFRFIGAIGARELDSFDGANRLADLAIANRMERAGKDAHTIKVATGWERGADGQWRYEVPDFRLKTREAASFTENRMKKLSDVLGKNNRLFMEYPELADFKVGARSMGEDAGSIIFEDKFISLDYDSMDEYADGRRVMSVESYLTLLHEVQHAIQHIEGFATGRNSTIGKDDYNRSAGEVEARNVEARVNMTPEQRRNTLASSTEDIDRRDQNTQIMFRMGPAAQMKKDGIARYLTPEQMADFVNGVFGTLDAAAQSEIINEQLNNGGDMTAPVMKHLSAIAEKTDVEGEDAAVVEAARKSLVSIIGAKDEDLTANDLLWVAFDYVHGNDSDIYERLRGQRVRRALDQTKSVAADMTLADYLQAAAEAKDDIMAQYTAMRELASRLNNVMAAMSARRDYDRATVGEIVELANEVLTSGLMDELTNGEVKRLISAIRKTTGMRNIQSRVNELYNLILTHNLRRLKRLFKKELEKKAVKVNNNNVVEQGTLDINGQIIMTAFKENMASVSEDNGTVTVSQSLRDKIRESIERYSDPETSSEEAHRIEMELVGLTMARDYIEGVAASEKEEQDLRDAMKDADQAFKDGELTPKAHREFIKEQTRALAENRTERFEAFTTLVQKMQDFNAASHGLALQFVQANADRIAQIHHDANSDMQGVPSDEHPKEATFLQKISNNPFTQFFFRPLATFDQMLRLFGNKSVNGEGYLWNRFMRGWVDATGKEYKAVQAAFKMLDDKVSEVFGRSMRWSDLYAVESKMPKATAKFFDGGVMKEHELTQGNLLYIMLADQMTDGRMKLRAMGIEEDHVDAIRAQMDPRFITLADWIVKDFLPSRREAYNAVHERMFGAPMSKVDNYFPLKVLANARTQQVDVASANADPSTPSTVTGNIMKRTKNALALDVMGTDAFSLVVEHVQKMEHWAAFAEWNRDLSDLMSYRRFRNQIQNMTSIYGSQRNLWTEFVDTAMIAAGSYQGKSGKLDPALNRMAKGVTAAKISLRVFTAIKQFLSFPAYFSEANPIYLAEGFFKGWNWSMDNLPLFEKRWTSRQAGDHILAEGNLGKLNEAMARVGMFPNALVDAFTVSIGSYAIYRTKYDKYVKMGFSPEAAEKRAKQDAVILYNETQQSSEAAFMSSMQSGRSTLEKMFTVFRNSSMGYQRQVHDALRNYKRRLTPGYKAESIEFMTKQLIREGLTERQAIRAAKAMFARQGVKDAVRLMIFGYGLQFFWSLAPYLPYLLLGDDDDKKKEMLMDAAQKGIFGSLEGLTGGNLISEAGNLMAFGEGLNNWDPELLPLVSDFKNLYQEFGKDNVRALNDLVNLGIQVGIGVNPQTLEDGIVAVIDACNGDLDTTKEVMLLALRLMNAPQTSLDQLYLDELDMNALEASKLTVPELAARYAEYKKMKGAGAMTPLYKLDPELDQKITEKYLNSFDTKAKERLSGVETDDRYAEIAAEAKAMAARVEALRKRAKDDDWDAEQELTSIFLSPDYGSLLRFSELSKDVNEAVKAAITSDTRKEMRVHLERAERLRRELVEDFSDNPSTESEAKMQFLQYSKGILPQMANLEKEYLEKFLKKNPDYKEWKEKHQGDLDKAAEAEKTTAERIAEIDAELKKYEIALPNGKKRYINKPERKRLNEEKKRIREEGMSEKAYLGKLKAGYTEKDYMPASIYNSPEFQAYLAVKSLGSVSGNTFSFKSINDLKSKMKEAKDFETQDKYMRLIEDRQILLAQQISRILNGEPEPDDESELE